VKVGAWIDSVERVGGDRDAIRMDTRSVNYAELADLSRAFVRELTSQGAAQGDVIAVLAPPSIVGVALIHAILDRGWVLLPLNARLTAAERREALESSGARFLVVAPAERDSGQALAREVGCGLWVLGADGWGDATVEVRLTPSGARAADFDERRNRRRSEEAALLLRTSGTSGRPKSAILGLDQLIASAVGSAELLGSAATDRWLLCMPLFHIGGLSILIRAALAGATVDLEKRFDEERVVAKIESGSITRVSFVATMLERVLALRGDQRAPESLELILLGGGPARADLLERAERLGYPVAPTYGLTEAASQVATRPPRSTPPRLGTGEVDRSGGLEALGGVALRIVDDAGQVLPPEQEGLIEVNGPTVMRGYLDDPDATARTLRGGWLSTGDIGRLSPAGHLRVIDRRTDLILSGGENVYPAEIESVLESHPTVLEAGVVGIPDERFGARPVAYVVLDDSAGREVDNRIEVLAGYCRERLAAFKCPVRIEVVSALPRNATGKLLRRALGRHGQN